jgi:hypothetical protein
LKYCENNDDEKINNIKNILQEQIKFAPNVSITHLINAILSQGN